MPRVKSNLSANEWTERILVALHDHQPWFERPLTHRELQIFTNLSADEVSRGCWQGRLQGLLNFEHAPEREGYTLTPLGAALARRLKDGHKPLYNGDLAPDNQRSGVESPAGPGELAPAAPAEGSLSVSEPASGSAAALAIASMNWGSGKAPTTS
jgi:hypothetical protein